MQKKTAAIIVIGNEILSGRTHDTNTNSLAKMLTKKGIQMVEARTVPDHEGLIVEAVNLMRERYDYVFTTGGIGPTHDDITAGCIAKAFGVPIARNREAYASLLGYYKDESKLNDARLKMADLPVGASLIDNPLTGAPGFKLENVYVLAGVPKIMQAMMEMLLPSLEGGIVIYSISVTVDLVESQIAQALGDMQDKNEDVDIGSYPSFNEGARKVSAVLRGADKAKLEILSQELQTIFKNLGGTILEVREL